MWSPFDLCNFEEVELPSDVVQPENRCIPVRLLPYLFLGGINTIGDFDTLRDLEITNILDVSDPFPGHLPRFPHDFTVTRVTGGCRFLHNVANNFKFIEKLLQSVKEKKQRILIFEFCPTSDRSSLVCAMHMIANCPSLSVQQVLDQIHLRNKGIEASAHRRTAVRALLDAFKDGSWPGTDSVTLLDQMLAEEISAETSQHFPYTHMALDPM